MGLTFDEERRGLLSDAEPSKPTVVRNDREGNPILSLEEAYVRIGHGWAQNRVLLVCG